MNNTEKGYRRKKRNRQLEWPYFQGLVWPMYLQHNKSVLRGDVPVVRIPGHLDSKEVLHIALDAIQNALEDKAIMETGEQDKEKLEIPDQLDKE